jgi:hypothetical protein
VESVGDNLLHTVVHVRNLTVFFFNKFKSLSLPTNICESLKNLERETLIKILDCESLTKILIKASRFFVTGKFKKFRVLVYNLIT